MGRIVFVLSLLGTLGLARGESLWLDHPAFAAQTAAEERKNLFVLFTDPDHCSACQRLERETLNRDEFITYSQVNLVLLLVRCDLRSRTTRNPKHEPLREALAVDRFPTWWLLDQDLSPLASGGYLRGGPQALLDLFEKSHRAPNADELAEAMKSVFSAFNSE